MKEQILQLTINGEHRRVAANTVTDLLEALGLNPQVTVVERNALIVDRASYATTALAEGDVLELVRIVGGG
jgi:sulfur carrier protein